MKNNNNNITVEKFNSERSALNYEGDDVQSAWVKYGSTNDLPNKLLRLIKEEDKSSIYHALAVNTTVKYIKADGLSLESSNDIIDVLPKVNEYNERPNDLLERMAYDFKILGGCCLEVIWDVNTVTGETEPRISEVYHIPFKNIRAKEQNSRGIVEGYFIYNKWHRNQDTDPAVNKDIEYIPVFNPTLASYNSTDDVKAQPKQLLVIKRYNPNSEYYPSPDYHGGITEILMDAEISNFQISHLSNAMIASKIIQIFGDFTDTQWDTMRNDIQDFSQGNKNAGEVLVLNAKNKSEAAEVSSPGGQKDSAEVYMNYKEDVQQRIFSIHGISFPEIGGVPSTGSGLSREQIMEKFTVFINTTIRPSQRLLLSGLNIIAPYWIPGEKFTINQIDIFEGLPLTAAEAATAAPEDVGDEEENTEETTVIPQENE